jgi:hypothetical protein
MFHLIGCDRYSRANDAPFSLLLSLAEVSDYIGAAGETLDELSDL